MSDDVMYTIKLNTPLGVLLAGSTPKGCCFIEFEDQNIHAKDRMLNNIQQTKLLLYEPNDILKKLEYEIQEYFNGDLHTFSVPLDIKGTPFQIAVWNKLCDIPYGKTKIYSQIANKIYKPRAVRAVATTIGQNPILILIPCHRVIGKNQELKGFSGGVWRKKKLLALESTKISFMA